MTDAKEKTETVIGEVKHECDEYEKKIQLAQTKIQETELRRETETTKLLKQVQELRKELGLISAQNAAVEHELEGKRRDAVTSLCKFLLEQNLQQEMMQELTALTQNPPASSYTSSSSPVLGSTAQLSTSTNSTTKATATTLSATASPPKTSNNDLLDLSDIFDASFALNAHADTQKPL